ncbi:dimethyl sulfoxide reductase anchor subunit family protein [Montanilutibacter psychrotolerans]|uniref:Dimethyl sulfoxide reductase anchor subunit n=1 Tax=Montanilutibacter psychrotolerans TaxID=1327343 RepID=A0A3M8SUJ4_9GAMM|nr:DmsC/YnfH family molybdoenzyme membrane anchor subunit [Lysobacter psychrotolerans]RNF84463.1 dimethyl sulfoxide reductase anchor subunit [Lysobacter psychrotolerans]
MHPAFSVLFFTTLSGAGYGLLALVAVASLSSRAPATPLLALLVLALLLVTTGLLSSLGHLGKPGRAWRAFSQWRSSWLSREGVMAVVTFAPALWLGWQLLDGTIHPALDPASGPVATHSPIAAVLAVVAAIATVACTAMIYASLRTIPAWCQSLVLPGYLLFSLLTGATLLASGLALAGALAGFATPLAVLLALAAAATALLKWRYWWAIDRQRMPATRGSAVGLPGREVGVFERPHTEDNYLTREMGFVVARKHARKLRMIALVLFGAVPLLAAVLVLALPAAAALAMPLAAAASLCGALVERWLFFAEAKHVVTLYY